MSAKSKTPARARRQAIQPESVDISFLAHRRAVYMSPCHPEHATLELYKLRLRHLNPRQQVYSKGGRASREGRDRRKEEGIRRPAEPKEAHAYKKM